MGRIEAKRKRFESAHDHAAEMKAMIDDAGDDGASFMPAYHYLMGYILLEEERFDEALEHVQQSRQSDPFNQWLLARAHAGVGDEDRAAEIARELVDMHPGSYGHALVLAQARAWLEENGGAH